MLLYQFYSGLQVNKSFTKTIFFGFKKINMSISLMYNLHFTIKTAETLIHNRLYISAYNNSANILLAWNKDTVVEEPRILWASTLFNESTTTLMRLQYVIILSVL